MRRFSEAEKQTIWEMREAGVPVKRIARHLGRQNVSLRKFIADAGGRRPTPRERSALRLSLAEREEISRGLAAGWSIRAVAAELDPKAEVGCHRHVLRLGFCTGLGVCPRDSRKSIRNGFPPHPSKSPFVVICASKVSPPCRVERVRFAAGGPARPARFGTKPVPEPVWPHVYGGTWFGSCDSVVQTHRSIAGCRGV